MTLGLGLDKSNLSRPQWGEATFIEQGVQFGIGDLLQLENFADFGPVNQLLMFLSWSFDGAHTGDEGLFTVNGGLGQWKRDSATAGTYIWRDATDSANGVSLAGSPPLFDDNRRLNLLVLMDADDAGDGDAYGVQWDSVGGARVEGAHDTVVSGLWTGDGTQNISITRPGLGLKGVMYRAALFEDVGNLDITQESVHDDFYNSSTGALVDPAIARAAYGTPIFDFNGDAARWNSGAHDGSMPSFTMTGAVTDV